MPCTKYPIHYSAICHVGLSFSLQLLKYVFGKYKSAEYICNLFVLRFTANDLKQCHACKTKLQDHPGLSRLKIQNNALDSYSNLDGKNKNYT